MSQRSEVRTLHGAYVYHAFIFAFFYSIPGASFPAKYAQAA